MSKFLAFLAVLVQCRTIVYPAVIGFVGSAVHLIGLNVEVEHKVTNLVDSAFGLLAVGVMVWGIMADQQNAKTKAAITNVNEAVADTNATATVAAVKAEVAATKLGEVAQVVNTNTAIIDPQNPVPSTTPMQYVTPPDPAVLVAITEPPKEKSP